MPKATPSEAVAALQTLKEAGFAPQSLDQLHDYLKLVGVVVGQLTLLRMASNPMTDPAARVSAARALMNVKESPEAIVERLRSSGLSSLTMDELEDIVRQVAHHDPQTLVSQFKAASHSTTDSRE